MSDDQATPVEEFVPEGSALIETVFRAPEFEVDVPDIETFRDLHEDDEEDDDEVTAEPVPVEQPAQPAPVTAEPAAAESE